MAKLIPYIIKSFRGGISGENDKGVAGSFKHGYALDIHKKQDSLTCKQAMLTCFDATRGVGSYGGTTITGLVRWFVPATDGSLYAFSGTGSIFCKSGEDVWNFVYQDENDNAVTGATEWGFDDGTNYMFWASSTSLARKPFPGVTVAPDSGTGRWTDATQNHKTLLDASSYHTMKPAGGSLIIANGNTLAEDSYAEDFDPYAVSIYPNKSVRCIEERDDYVIFGTLNDDEAVEGHLWSWVTYATNFIQKKRIPADGVNALVTGELPLAQAGTNGEIFFSDFENVTAVAQNAGDGWCEPDAVCLEENLALFGFSDSDYPGIWSYGRKQRNRTFAFNYDYRLAKTVGGSTVTNIGAITNHNGVIYASWQTTDGSTLEYGVDSSSSTTKATAVYEGLEFDGGRPFWKKMFNSVKLGMAPLPTSCSVSVKFKMDKETDWRYAFLGDNTTTFTTANATEAEFLIHKWGKVMEVGVELNPYLNTTPEILSINTYLDDSGYEH